MKLLFGKSGWDTRETRDEFKGFLQYVNADLKGSESDCYTACTELKKEIGKETYEYLVELYETPPTNEEELQIIYQARLAVAERTIHLYLPKKDLAITDNGRKMYRDESTVSAFEHQIVAQDEAIERSYYRSLSNLLELLDEVNPTITGANKWKHLSVYQASQKLIIPSHQIFNEVYPINSYFLYKKLLPGIKHIQTFEVKPLLNEDSLANIFSDTPEENILHHVRHITVFGALAWGIKRLRVQMFPEGILQEYRGEQNTIRGKKVSEKMEAELVAQSFEDDMRRHVYALASYTNKLGGVEDCQDLDFFNEDDNYITF